MVYEYHMLWLVVTLCIYDMIDINIDFVYCSQQGNIIPPSVKPGDEVLLPEYGGTKVVLEDKVL